MNLNISLRDPTSTYDTNDLYEGEVSYNLTIMAEKCGLEDVLWNTEHLTQAKDIIDEIKQGLIELNEKPEYYSQFNSLNGIGTYSSFLIFLEEYLLALKKYPLSIIETYQ